MGRDEAALLLISLRGLPIAVPRDMDWHFFLRLAEENGVLPLIHRSLLKQGVTQPDFFASAAQKCLSDTAIFAAALESLLEKFAQQCIEVIPLKGPVLAEKLYKDNFHGKPMLALSDDRDKFEAFLHLQYSMHRWKTQLRSFIEYSLKIRTESLLSALMIKLFACFAIQMQLIYKYVMH